MKKLAALIGAAMVGGLGLAGAAAAQSVVIANAHIIDGAGRVIERGSVVARDGKIVSVGPGAPRDVPAGATTIDAAGMTVMAGFIDAHRHIIRGPADAWLKNEAPRNMREFLEGGFTTIYSMADDPKGILELRRRLQAGEILGPRLFAVKVLPLNRPASPPPRPAGPPVDPARTDASRAPRLATALAIPDEESRAAVQQAKREGFDAIKTFMVRTPDGPEIHTLSVIADEGRKQGLRTFTHAVTVEDALASVEAKTDTLAHTPHIGSLVGDQANIDRIAKAGIPMVSTLAVFIPHFDKGNRPLFRDGAVFPWANLESGGQGPVNARLLWQDGITYAYGTDTTWLPRESLADELRALQTMFSPVDIVKIMGPNAAIAIGKQDQLGTLEPGKTADLVILRGDPLADVEALLRVVAVVKDGKVVVDHRNGRAAQRR